MFRKTTLSVFFLCFCTGVFAQLNNVWTNLYDAGGTPKPYDIAYQIVYKDSILMVGGETDPDNLVSTDKKTLLMRLDTSGVITWVSQITDPNESVYFNHLLIDSSGNTFVAGDSEGILSMYLQKFDANGAMSWSFSHPIYNGTASKFVMSNSGAVNIVHNFSSMVGYNAASVYRHEANSSQTWSDSITSTQDFGYIDLENDSLNNLYVIGTETTTGDRGILSRKYDVNGNVLWTSHFLASNTPPYFYIHNNGMKVSPYGDLYALGEAAVTTTDFDFLIVKYNSNGGLCWYRTFDSGLNKNDQAMKAAFDSGNDIVVAGVRRNSINNQELLLQKYDSAGTLLWTQTFDPLNVSFTPNDLKIDANDNIYVCSAKWALKYSSSGTLLWSWYPVDFVIYDFDIDSTNNIYFCGVKPNNGIYRDDIVVAKYQESLTGYVDEGSSPVPDFVLFPNPADGNTVNIRTANNANNEPVNLLIKDISGKTILETVFDGKSNGYSLNCNAMAAGVYFFQFQTATSLPVIKKFIKTR